ncbi:hypothetical protein FNV43_RR27282 [Rhamnella rubrinervis]|uniref:DUF1985 domain-containing protein n=1 Tax=Rhamnella rubrinervis TaxID=2594499 RepID=A0A8K0DK30_9ROSA|nr:hypothetical protein FNV43_RR27282 [Rhamnella rubrinervis]
MPGCLRRRGGRRFAKVKEFRFLGSTGRGHARGEIEGLGWGRVMWKEGKLDRQNLDGFDWQNLRGLGGGGWELTPMARRAEGLAALRHAVAPGRWAAPRAHTGAQGVGQWNPVVDVPPPPQANRIRNTYFGHLKKIKNSNVRDVFLGLKRSKLEDKDNMVRLALIYFLECGLLGQESQVSIDIQHLFMVENLEYFNEYVWGLESYNATISFMHRVLTLHDGKLNESATYSLSGFPQAFQV